MSATTDARSCRVGVAGVGIGARYAESFQSIPGVEVVALCASSERRAGPLARELPLASVYLSFEEMLARERLDVAVVATPNDLHYPMVLAALDSGAHVLCDKPLALSSGEARALLEAATRHDVRHVVPFWFRFVPAMARARELLSDGSFGELRFVDVRFLNCGWGNPDGEMRWQFERARAGSGAISNLGSHAIDALHWLAGDLARISATSSIAVTDRLWPDGRPGQPDADDTATFIGELTEGAPVSFLVSSVAYTTRSAFSIAVHASGGSVTVQLETDIPYTRLRVMRRGDVRPQDIALPDPQGRDLAFTAYDLIARELVEAIRSGRDAVPGFVDGLRAQVVIDAALTSAATREWVAVEYDPDTGSHH
jgi:predicted dehydrogenase